MARKYLLALRARLPGVAFRDRSGGFPKSWEFDVVVSLITLPWLGVFIACGTGGSAQVSSPSTATPSTASSDSPSGDVSAAHKSEFTLEVEARALAWETVEEHLTFPHDAEFSWLTQCKRLNDHSFAAFGTVKAANALGAKLTYDWRVVLALNDRDQFLPMYIQIGDEESVLASDDLLANFLGRPTSAEAEAIASEEAAKAARAASFRTFRDDTGDFAVEARLVSFRNHQQHGGMITIEKETGTVVELPISRLSTDDQAWVRDEIKRRAEGR